MSCAVNRTTRTFSISGALLLFRETNLQCVIEKVYWYIQIDGFLYISFYLSVIRHPLGC